MNDCGLLFFYAETAVHPGGSESVGAIDLPIQREATTDLPTVWGQSSKGALRQYAREAGWPDVEAVFGSSPPGTPGSDDKPPKPGWLSVGDLRLVAFPVPTLQHTFAWVTSPLLLARQARQAQIAGLGDLPGVPRVDADHVVPAHARWSTGSGSGIAIGEYDLHADDVDDDLTQWASWLAGSALPERRSVEKDDGEKAEKKDADKDDPFAYFRTKLSQDLLLVSDDQLQSLTREYAEVSARVQLRQDVKTVQHGPWYTEYLPAETIMCSLLRNCSPNGDVDSLGTRLDGTILVAGGDETIGKGLMWLRWLGREREG